MGEYLYIPTNIRDAVASRFEQLRSDIASSIATHGLTASGKTAASMYVVANNHEVALYGRAFFAALETGSSRWTGKTGIPCSWYEFKEIIRNWASAKGLNFGQHKEHERTLGAITTSIIKHGTEQTRKPRLDVYTSLVDQAVKDCESICVDIVNAQVNNVIAQWR